MSKVKYPIRKSETGYSFKFVLRTEQGERELSVGEFLGILEDNRNASDFDAHVSLVNDLNEEVMKLVIDDF